jgi:anti-anti-sigma factor
MHREDRGSLVVERGPLRHQTLSSLPFEHPRRIQGMAMSPPTPAADRHVRVTVAEVDRSTVADFAQELSRHPPGPYRLVVDLADLVFIDAAGLRVLLDTAQAMADAGGTIALQNPCRILCRLLELMELEHVLPST